ncbi:amino acid permease-domain-containing protein [Podospora didyma]|uniref:Amino acid permease-domain-containing protein n=1 Tax=Podospora didyma TaxID=330526 RepID=A0AAE0K384_9PEZI|nr:amino acid permease-domain-containing protein [Podospora didyma]
MDGHEPEVEMAMIGNDAEEHQLQTLSREQLEERIHQYNSQKERFDVAPTPNQLFGSFTVFCLIINRTIASGIFTQPVNVLRGAGSSGVAVALWVAAGLIIICIVACWTELALTIPLHYVFENERWRRISAPRSGGDKNYLEYIYKRPRNLMKCIFGIAFIIFGNLAGNALQFGVFMSIAINPRCDETSGCLNQGHVVGWGVSILTICALINVTTRRYTITLNNIFAVCKLSFVFVLALLGVIYGSTHGGTCQQISWKHQGDGGGQLGDVVLALFYAMYPYTGYEQPFYVLAEVSQPQRRFARATMYAMGTTLVLFPLVNVSYLCMVPYAGNKTLPENIVIAFFDRIANDGKDGKIGDNDNTGSVRAVAAILAVFIFGNLMAQTYTASRVKQEIAKEGILPWSLKIATGNDTLISRLGPWNDSPNPSKLPHQPHQPAVCNLDGHREQSPIAATALHWFFEVVLVLAVGLATEPSKAYRLLTYLYTFIIVGVMGLFTVGGLLYLKIDSLIGGRRTRNWRAHTVWQPWLDPLPAVVATLALGFLLIAAFVASGDDRQSLRYWIGPTVGWVGGVGLGVIWWVGLWFLQWSGRWRLETKRFPFIEIDEDGQAIQRAELVEHNKVPTV